eukprot:513865_1
MLLCTEQNRPHHTPKQALFNDCMTSIPSINKTDALTLASTFGSMEKVFSASREDLIRCPGLGDIKVSRIKDALHAPFRSDTFGQFGTPPIFKEDADSNT